MGKKEEAVLAHQRAGPPHGEVEGEGKGTKRRAEDSASDRAGEDLQREVGRVATASARDFPEVEWSTGEDEEAGQSRARRVLQSQGSRRRELGRLVLPRAPDA